MPTLLRPESHRITLRDGARVVIRPIHPTDEPLMARFHETLSDRSVYHRYFHPVALGARIDYGRLTRICHVDHERDHVLVAEGADAAGHPCIVAVGRLSARDDDAGEFALIVSDAAQGQGLGTELLRQLVRAACDAGRRLVTGDVLLENVAMRAVAEKLGFHSTLVPGEGLVRVELPLR